MLCKLCQNEELKENSHIVPAFVFRWLKASSPTGFLRKSRSVNKRINDGEKSKLLGPNCEDSFSTWEKKFAEKVFHPVHKSEQYDLEFDYGEWLAKFCVSLSWRVLTHGTLNGANHQSHGHSSLIHPALEVWQDYLCGRREDISGFRQHFIILDQNSMSGLEKLNHDDLSFYIRRGVDCDTVHANEECYVISKLCNILIVGSILEKPTIWKNTEVSLIGGHYGVKNRQLSSCVTTLFETGIDALKEGRNSISPKQSNKILEAFERKHSLKKRKSI
jgi:hypothetical protein